jgi:hypothetical protein
MDTTLTINDLLDRGQEKLTALRAQIAAQKEEAERKAQEEKDAQFAEFLKAVETIIPPALQGYVYLDENGEFTNFAGQPLRTDRQELFLVVPSCMPIRFCVQEDYFSTENPKTWSMQAQQKSKYHDKLYAFAVAGHTDWQNDDDLKIVDFTFYNEQAYFTDDLELALALAKSRYPAYAQALAEANEYNQKVEADKRAKALVIEAEQQEQPARPEPQEALTCSIIHNAYTALSVCRQQLHTAAENVIALRYRLDCDRAAKIATGEIGGKNETERKAAERFALRDLYEQIDSAEFEERNARCAFDVAQTEVDRVKALLRLAEVTK